jgi:DNA-binding PadR family transcriptional regulator
MTDRTLDHPSGKSYVYRYIGFGANDDRGEMKATALGGWSNRSLLVLTSLAGGAKHGYALIQDILEFADIKLGPGTLYGCLSTLERAGLVAALPAEERRHPYQITPQGLAVLEAALAESARLAAVGLRRIAGALP